MARVQADSKNVASLCGLAKALLAAGDDNKASMLYRRALQLDQSCVEALVGLARIAWEGRSRDESLAR